MKKLFFAGIIAFVTVLCVSATTIAESSSLDKYEGYIEYNIPNITSGTMTLEQFETIFRLRPDDIQKQAKKAFEEITSIQVKSFTYGGVQVKHPYGSSWEFYFKGASVKVTDASYEELSEIFKKR